MLLSLCPTDAFAENKNDQNSTKGSNITIAAKSDNPITIKGKTDIEPELDPDAGPIVDGRLYISSDSYTIERDYEQECFITVSNHTDESVEFYLDVTNKYSDLSMDIIKAGSKNSPALLMPNESIEVELSVFAQNAENERYTIPLSAYIFSDGQYIEDAKNNIILNCELPVLDLSWELINTNESTLMQTWRITNHGETLTDLSVDIDDALKEYAIFSPVVSNYELKSGMSVDFNVRPDLVKMNKEMISSLGGMLIAYCAGKRSEKEILFDTKGNEITVATMGQLALEQSGNPFSRFDVKEDSINYSYYVGEEEFAINENTDFTDSILDDGSFHIQEKVLVDIGNDFAVERIFDIKTYACEKDMEIGQIDTEIAELDDGTIQLKAWIAISEEDYDSMVEKICGENDTQSAMSILLNSEGMSLDDAASYVTEFTTQYNDIIDLAEKAYKIDHNLPKDTIDPLHLGPMGSHRSLSVLNHIYNAYGIIDGTRKTINVYNSPVLSDEIKESYLSIHLYKILLTEASYYSSLILAPVCPAAALLMGAATYIASKYFDGFQEGFLETAYKQAYAELYSEIKGHQCTNRGKVTVPFYVPDYNRNNDRKPKIYTTSRMHGDGYVDKEDTNYDITLNGEDAGRVTDTGLTDVTIAELPSDKLIPGDQNTVEFDYDTNPGSHFVTTDTEITMLYPNDTEIAFIGDPEDLQDVRTKPDFCIYDENIFASDKLIVGEPGYLSFNVYNRGSRGGWFNIVAYENGTEIYRNENYYLDEFSGNGFNVEWTPSSETADIRVELENTSIGLDERRVDNNIASKTLDARTRQIPEVVDLISGTINEKSPFSIVIGIANTDDVTNASFVLDEETQPSEIRDYLQSEYSRYWLRFNDGIDAGTHKISAKVTYKTSQNIEETIIKTFEFDVLGAEWIEPYASMNSETVINGSTYEFYIYNTENLIKTEVSIGEDEYNVVEPISVETSVNSYIISPSVDETGEYRITVNIYYYDSDGNEAVKTFSQDVTLVSEDDSYYTVNLMEDYEDVAFTVFRNGSEVQCEFEKDSSGTYRCLRTLDMYENPENYTVIVTYPSAIYVTDMIQNGMILSEDNYRRLIFEKSEKGTLTSALVDRISVSGQNDCSVYIDVDTEKPLLVTPGNYEVHIQGEYDGISINKYLDCAIDEEDYIIEWSSLVNVYDFVVETPSDQNRYDAKLYYKEADDTYWSSDYMYTFYNPDTNELKCYTTSSWIIADLKESDEVKLLITTPTEIYLETIRGGDKYLFRSLADKEEKIILDRSKLNKVLLKTQTEGWEIGQVELRWDDYSATLSGEEVYIPDGDYTLSTELSSGGLTLYKSIEKSVDTNCQIIVELDFSGYRDVTVSWKQPFEETGDVEYSSSGGNAYSYGVESGGVIKVEEGERSFCFDLVCDDARYNVSRTYDVKTDNNQITIGNCFEGEITNSFNEEYDGGQDIWIYLSGLKDTEGNELTYAYVYYTPLYGHATFTDINDSSRVFTKEFSANNISDCLVELPDESGTFMLSVELSTKSLHTVSFNTMGGTAITSERIEDGGLIDAPNDPERENYVFKGWFVDERLTVPYNFDNPVFEDITLYAKWEIVDEIYTITFDSMGGSKVEAIDIVKGHNLEKPDDPTKEGFEFQGWYVDKDYTSPYDFDKVVTSNSTLYAKWKANDIDHQQGKTSIWDIVRWKIGRVVSCTRKVVQTGYLNSDKMRKLFASLRIGKESNRPEENIDQNTKVTGFVSRMYRFCLGREADASGLASWVSALLEGRATGTKIATGFFSSPEMKQMNLSNYDFVVNAYVTLLDRQPDEKGLSAWVRALDSGGDRNKIVRGFVKSEEFGNLCAEYGIAR